MKKKSFSVDDREFAKFKEINRNMKINRITLGDTSAT